MPLGKIQFPVLTDISISHYDLYPGADGTGVEHKFPPGVSIIVGINGLGKTTFLHTILRSLLGSYDPTKADLQRPGTRKHTLTHRSRFRFFGNRVSDRAEDATVSAEFRFGKNTLTVERSLANLKILSVRHNGANVGKADEDQYGALAQELSGVTSRYDFDFLVRHLVFFTEDKIPLIWSPEGQFEILRILFLEPNLASECAATHDRILAADSAYRNYLWHTNLLQERLEENKSRDRQAARSANEIALLESSHEAVQEQLTSLEGVLLTLETELQTTEERLVRLDIDINEKSLALEHAEHQFLGALFPDLSDAATHVVGTLLSGEGCTVCGNRSNRGLLRMRSLLANRTCPICESPPEEQENLPADSEFDPDVLTSLDSELAQLRKEHADTSETLTQLRADYDAQKEVQRDLWRKQTDIFHQLEDVKAKTSRDAEMESLMKELSDRKRETQSRKTRLEAAREKYKKLLELANNDISAAADRIVELFNRYAQEFMSDNCILSYQMHRRTLGEGGAQLDFPNFSVQMSSGAFSTPTARNSKDEVSESQKEFIDLAFRMALIETASHSNCPGMLIIETPEASLDSIFIDRAGNMLRRFAERSTDGDRQNTVIATSNLNRENMIPALLGLSPDTSRDDRNRIVNERIINLLKISAPSSALRQYGDQYWDSFNTAIGLPSK